MYMRPKCQQHAIVTIVLAMAALGGKTQIGTFLLAKANKEGDIAGINMYKLCPCTLALRFIYIGVNLSETGQNHRLTLATLGDAKHIDWRDRSRMSILYYSPSITK
jgi:hypothetical protein